MRKKAGVHLRKRIIKLDVKNALLVAVIGLVFLLLIIVANSVLQLNPLDFDNYWDASRLILHNQNPYYRVEFFSPPWIAFFLFPLLFFPKNTASIVWLFVNLLSLGALSIISITWLDLNSRIQKYSAFLLAFLLPGSLFSNITGQVSPLVIGSTMLIAWQISTSIKSGWMLSLAVLTALLKPHIVIFPLMLCFLELVKQHKWKTLIQIASAGLFVVIISYLILPDWLPSLIEVWKRGDYLGGKPGLISPGYTGLRELGIPVWVLVWFGLYGLFRWWREGLTREVIALSLVINLLLIPYSRVYDFVVLIFPILSLLTSKSRLGYVFFSITAVAAVFLPLSNLSLLAPVIVTISLLSIYVSDPFEQAGNDFPPQKKFQISNPDC